MRKRNRKSKACRQGLTCVARRICVEACVDDGCLVGAVGPVVVLEVFAQGTVLGLGGWVELWDLMIDMCLFGLRLQLFDYVLEYLRDQAHRFLGDSQLPEDVSMLRALRREAEFYQLPTLVARINKVLQSSSAGGSDVDPLVRALFDCKGPGLVSGCVCSSSNLCKFSCKPPMMWSDMVFLRYLYAHRL